MIDMGNGGRRGVGEAKDGFVLNQNIRLLHPMAGLYGCEPVGDLHVVAAPDPLLLVAGDAVPAPKPHTGHLQQGENSAIGSVKENITHRASLQVGLSKGSAFMA